MSGRVKPYATYGISPGSEVDILGAIHLTVEDSSGSVSESSPIGKPYGITNTAYSYERYIIVNAAEMNFREIYQIKGYSSSSKFI